MQFTFNCLFLHSCSHASANDVNMHT